MTDGGINDPIMSAAACGIGQEISGWIAHHRIWIQAIRRRRDATEINELSGKAREQLRAVDDGVIVIHAIEFVRQSHFLCSAVP